MDTPAAKPDGTAKVQSLHSQALGNLEFIRQTMEGAGSFTAVPGTAGITMGTIGVLAALLASLPALASHWLMIWLVAAALAALTGSLLIWYKAVAAGITIYTGPAKRFVLALAPALLAGAVLTIVLAYSNLDALIPGTWLLLYGCGVMAASVVSLPLITTLGACFMLLGMLAFVAPFGIENWLLGAGFGGLHLVFGVLLARQHRG
ncbi:MAG: hypothetical protein QNJ73_03070 [Gammaproteobacteria bacterium]|nr:hypothetical protein [Gammaproteobacteria bacterium]